jgi:hypothetical protein
MSYSFSRKEVSRERVVGLTLIDIFIQLIFLLLGLLLYIYQDDYSSEKWEEFSRNGKSVYGSSFSESWEKMPNDVKDLREKLNTVQKGANSQAQSVTGAFAPGKQACLDKAKREPSAKFLLSKEGIHFIEFSAKFKSYLKDSFPEKLSLAHSIESKSNKLFDVDGLRRDFAFIKDSDCQHFFEIREAPDLVTDKQSYEDAKRLSGAVTSLGR